LQLFARQRNGWNCVLCGKSPSGKSIRAPYVADRQQLLVPEIVPPQTFRTGSQGGGMEFKAKKGDVWSCAKGMPENGKNTGNTVAIMRVIDLLPT
jgi:hypothetical protein